MQSTSIESRIILAIQALEKDPKMPVRRAASTFEVPESTLRDRRAGRVARGERRPNSMKMTITEEEVILERVINLIDRGFPPRQEDEQSIIALYMPPHSSHKLQPLNIRCFSPLKYSYGKEIKKIMRMQISHITKDDFFPAFKAAFFASIGENNVRAGFRQAGLVPFNPEVVLSRLDFKPKTPTPSNSRPSSQGSWDAKTPTTALEGVRSASSLKKKIQAHQGSSPTPMYEVINFQARGISKLAHRLAIVEAENRKLRTGIEVLKALQVEKGGVDAGGENNPQKEGRTEGAEPRARRCGNCGKSGHNARTCEVVWDSDEEEVETDHDAKGAWLELLKETADPSDNRYVTKCTYDGVEKPFNIPVHWHKVSCTHKPFSYLVLELQKSTAMLTFQHHDEHITVVEGRITATVDGKDTIVKAGDPPLVVPRLHLHGFRGFPGESCVFEERNLPSGDYKVL
ncbi:transposase [Colletotrichum incanum]|uniref:Transposase n=1 Tax=Colletotrichum incanum TaxID=1573173 RepID=A0A167EJ09_COLIC|nr:transposase [Colletotrichum incanum]